MRSWIVMPSVALGIALCIGTPASAGQSQATTASPGGFIQAGAWTRCSGCGFNPGADMSANFVDRQDFHEQGFSGVSWAQASASFSSATISNSAAGSVGMGLARMMATNTFTNESSFPAGIANGGWKETFTVSHSGLDGQAGFLVFQIRARGTLDVTGGIGSTSFKITGYKDNLQLLPNALFDPGNADVVSGTNQMVTWRLSSSSAFDVSRLVDGTVTMAVPITFGQSFTLGIYAIATAGQRAQGGNGTFYGSSTVDFYGNGVQWAGIASVQSGGVPVAGYTIISGSGIDWSLPLDGLDSDGDEVIDSFDCAPLDPGAFSIPGEVTGDVFAADGETYAWTSAAPISGAGTVHDVMRGELRQLPVGGGIAEICLASGIPASSTTDATTPALGNGFYYLVRGWNACGSGGYGFATGGAERITATCP